MQVTPKACHSTTSVSTVGRLAAVHAGRPVSPPAASGWGEGHLLGGNLPGGVPLIVGVGGDPQGPDGKCRPAGDGAVGGGEEGGVDAPTGRWHLGAGG